MQTDRLALAPTRPAQSEFDLNLFTYLLLNMLPFFSGLRTEV